VVEKRNFAAMSAKQNLTGKDALYGTAKSVSTAERNLLLLPQSKSFVADRVVPLHPERVARFTKRFVSTAEINLRQFIRSTVFARTAALHSM